MTIRASFNDIEATSWATKVGSRKCCRAARTSGHRQTVARIVAGVKLEIALDMATVDQAH